MNYILHLSAVFEKMDADTRLSPFHISLYMALFRRRNLNTRSGRMRKNLSDEADASLPNAIRTVYAEILPGNQFRIHQKRLRGHSEIVPELANRILSEHTVKSWSFDKGFWHKNNKELLSESVETLVLPKKGKCNKQEYEQEHHPKFIRNRNKHSAIESNINELEHRGRDRCPDKGYMHFKRYVGFAVSAYNLRKIGAELIRLTIEKEQRNKVFVKLVA